jgi:hypothetical protein
MLWLKDVILIHPDHSSLVIISSVKTGTKSTITFSQAPSMQNNATKNALQLVGA